MSESSYCDDERPHKKTTSLYDVKFEADVMPDVPAYNFLAYGDSIHACMDKFGHMDDDEPIFFDDIDWNDRDANRLLQGFGDVVDCSFDIKNMYKTNELSAAMNLPIISALNAHVPSLPEDAKVCIIGADRGQNITQCETARGVKPLDWTITCVEPTSNSYVLERLQVTLEPYTQQRIINKKLFDACADGDFTDASGRNVEYDCIIHNLGLHVVCASQDERLMYVDFIRSHLKLGGKLLGTSIDIDALRRSDDLGMRSPMRSLELVQEYPPSPHYADGMAYVRVGSTMFRDPILPMHSISTMFSDLNFHTVLIPGKYLFRKKNEEYRSFAPRYPIPETKFWQNVARRPELSVVTYVQVERVALGSRVNDEIRPVKGQSKWELVAGVTENEIARCYFPMNHGRALIPSDLVFCDVDDVFIAPKWDGVAGRISISQGIAFMVVEDRKIYRALLPNNGCIHNMKLQVEVLPDIGDGMRVIVVDAYMIGTRSPVPFQRRWELFKQIYDASDLLQSIVSCQSYESATVQMYQVLETMMMNADVDGIVVQNKHAMPGSFKDGIGSARYLKNRYTIDIEHDGEIKEVDFKKFMDGDIDVVKLRPDKRRANGMNQLVQMAEALSIVDFKEQFSIARCPLYLGDIPTVLMVLAGTKTYEAIPVMEKVYMYRARFDDHRVVNHICQGSAPKFRRLHYNMYMHIKNKVLSDVITTYHRHGMNIGIPVAKLKEIRVNRRGEIITTPTEDNHHIDLSDIV